jgi:hypothetical protein
MRSLIAYCCQTSQQALGALLSYLLSYTDADLLFFDTRYVLRALVVEKLHVVLLWCPKHGPTEASNLRRDARDSC